MSNPSLSLFYLFKIYSWRLKMDNNINNDELRTEPKPRNYKKEYLIGLFVLIAFAFIELFFSGIYGTSVTDPLIWIILVTVGIATHREDWKEYILWIFTLLLNANRHSL